MYKLMLKKVFISFLELITTSLSKAYSVRVGFCSLPVACTYLSESSLVFEIIQRFILFMFVSVHVGVASTYLSDSPLKSVNFKTSTL